jgi:hypothetical protein
VDCPTCRGLEGAFEAAYGEYIEARQSASYRFCTKFAAHKMVDMERARYELEEHGVECIPALRLMDVLPSPSIRDSIDDSVDRSNSETEELFQLAEPDAR